MKLIPYTFLFLFSSSSFAGDFSLSFVNEDKGSPFQDISDYLFPEAEKSDGNYSQSLYLSYGFNAGDSSYLKFAFQNDVFSPSGHAKNKEFGVVGDRPFASSLQASVDLKTKFFKTDNFDLVVNPVFSFGTVGSDSGGGRIQDFFHDLKEASEYLGWEDEVESKKFKKYSLQAKPRIMGLGGKVAIEPAAFYVDGDLVSYHGYGGALRFGTFDMRRDFGLSHIGITQSGSLSPSNGAAGLGVSGYIGFEKRVMDENYFLEGQTSISNQTLVTIEDEVTDIVVGFNVYFSNVLLDLAIIERSKEYTTQNQKQSFLRANLGFAF